MSVAGSSHASQQAGSSYQDLDVDTRSWPDIDTFDQAWASEVVDADALFRREFIEGGNPAAPAPQAVSVLEMLKHPVEHATSIQGPATSCTIGMVDVDHHASLRDSEKQEGAGPTESAPKSPGACSVGSSSCFVDECSVAGSSSCSIFSILMDQDEDEDSGHVSEGSVETPGEQHQPRSRSRSPVGPPTPIPRSTSPSSPLRMDTRLSHGEATPQPPACVPPDVKWWYSKAWLAYIGLRMKLHQPTKRYQVA